MYKSPFDVTRETYLRTLCAMISIVAFMNVYWFANVQDQVRIWSAAFTEMEKVYATGVSLWKKTYEDMERKLSVEIREKEEKVRDLESRMEALYAKTNEVRASSVPDGKKIVVRQLPGSIVTVEATAYTANCEGCSGVTRTGIDVRNHTPKIIAVDPDVIPLGKKVEIFVDGKSWGVWEAQDTGRDIKGLRIDILMDSVDEALEFGRKEVQLKILD